MTLVLALEEMVSSDFPLTVSVTCHWINVYHDVSCLCPGWGIVIYLIILQTEFVSYLLPFLLYLLAEVPVKVEVHRRIQAANITFLCRYGKILSFLFFAPFLVISNVTFWLLQEFWSSPEILTIQLFSITSKPLFWLVTIGPNHICMYIYIHIYIYTHKYIYGKSFPSS